MSQRLTILGAGESGTGAALLAKVKGYEVFVTDAGMIKDKYRDDLLRHKIDFEEGGHTEGKILKADLIIKSPGIPDTAAIVVKARQAGIDVLDEIEFAFRFITGKVIAITGTNGKTTTTLLTYHLMKAAGFSVTLAGNVGESLARKIAYDQHDWYVLEISSFQLDGTKTFKPTIGILLNITPDHLDRYDYQFEKYINSKFRLIQNMDEHDHFIYFADDTTVTSALASRNVLARKIPITLKYSNQDLVGYDGTQMNFSFVESFSIKQSDTTLKGSHNLVNTMAAVTAVYHAGGKVKDIRKGLKSFKNAPHRLEVVASIHGVDFINDSKATNVDSVVYALGSFKNKIIWIAGGIDKGNDYTLIRDEVNKKVNALICMGTDNSKLMKFFKGIVPVIHETKDVRESVRLGLREAKPGDVVLLSPACASFDLFKNYEDRGDQFRTAVLEVKKEVENQLV